eukprot:gene34335-41562_t
MEEEDLAVEIYEMTNEPSQGRCPNGRMKVSTGFVTSPTPLSLSGEFSLKAPFIQFCAKAFAALLGAYIRVGISYYRIWKIETNYCVMYTQLVGCFVMGLMLPFKPTWYSQPTNSFQPVMYVAITSGLCGSITTFSSWMIETNKNFFLQWDLSWGNAGGSYNGGRFFEWLVSMWVGVAVPLAALRLGKDLSSHYLEKHSDSLDTKSILSVETKEGLVVACFVVAFVAVIVVPVVAFKSWVFLTYTAVLGVAGAYLRYQLSFLNPIYKSFPIGTFIANVSGTWILAVLVVLSKFTVDYYDTETQAVLYGLGTGFCGCLTTVSTLVSELDSLPATDSYVYGLTTHALAQLGIIFIYNVFAYTQVTPSMVMPPSVNQCQVVADLCSNILTKIACPSQDMVNLSCADYSDYETYQGLCSCGSLDASHMTEVMIDSQVRYSATNSLAAIWPRSARASDSPTEAIDFCLSYQNMCSFYFDRIGCPFDQRKLRACDRQGILNAHPICSCGGNDMPGDRLQELVVDQLLFRRYDLLPYNGYVTMATVDFCSAYESACHDVLDHIQCPPGHGIVKSCAEAGDYSTWIGECSCGNFDTTKRIAEDLFDSMVRANQQPLIFVTNTSSGASFTENTSATTFDMCWSYSNICNLFLDMIGCEGGMRNVSTCDGVTASHPYGQVQLFHGNCSCGSLDLLVDRAAETVEDTLSFELINSKYIYIAPPQAPYTLLVSSNPFSQLLF